MTGSAHKSDGVLEVRQLSKRFGGLKVFENVSFSLRSGQVLGVIGPNGAGKTTLINMICGKLLPTSGQIILNGTKMNGKPLHVLAKAGVVRSFQQTNTFKDATVRENISRAIRFSGADRSAWSAIAGMLDEFELTPKLDVKSDKLAYGLQKMLGLILIYVVSPKFLLLDEPGAGLERSERTRIDTFVHRAQQELGCGILIVEHDLDLVRRLCPDSIVLDAGQIIASGPPHEVLSRKDVIDAYIGATEDEVV